MDEVGWIVGGYFAYVGLAIGAALFLALAIAVIRGGRRMRSLEQRLARAEQGGRVHSAQSLAVTPPPQATADTDGDDDALVPTPLRSSDELVDAAPVDRGMFWDQLLRESVVRAAAIGHGIRAVLDPRTRHRIRFEVRQEIKRARKQRRTDERAAVRQLRQDRLEDSA